MNAPTPPIGYWEPFVLWASAIEEGQPQPILLDSSHLVTWRRQRTDGLSPKKRGRKAKPVDPQVKRLEQENRRLTSRLQKAEALLAFQKKVSELLQIPLKPFLSDEND